MTEKKNSNRSTGKTSKKKRKSYKKPILIWVLVITVLGIVCALVGYMIILLSGEKHYQMNKDKMEMAEAAVFYDVNQKEVTTMARENRELVTLAEMPDKLPKAFVATEDKRFSEHSGIDFFSIGRAIVKDVIHRSAVEGGSTITQQLAKNMFLNADKTIFRKATEASIAIALENHKTKDEILEMYLNRIYFGKSAWGVKAAAKKYFGKSDLKQLALWEMATLAAIPKAPSHYNPLDNPEKSKERRAVVLMLMQEQGYITEQEKAEAAAKDYVAPPVDDKMDYVTFLDYAVSEAVTKSGLTEDELLRGGYQIYTTLEPTAQKAAETAFSNPDFFQKDGPEQIMQAGMTILNNKDGGVVAMVGGRDYKTKTWNRAVKPRQPGSSFKPIIEYAPALELKGYNPYTMLKDEKVSYGSYSPNNYDNIYLGNISMMKAIEKSANAPAVALLNEIGVRKAMTFAEKFGITFDKKDENLAIALGGMTVGTSPLQLASAYTTFANNGQLNPTYSIVKILDKDGKEKYKYKPDKPKQVMSAKNAYYMTLMLKNAVDVGTGTNARMNRPVAGKTGSTQLDLEGLKQYYRDVWFAGYTPEWTAAIWMGFDTTDSKHFVNGGSGRPAALFKEIMTKALAGKPVGQFQKPSGVPDLNEAPPGVTDLTASYDPNKKSVKLNWTAPKGDKLTYSVFRKAAKDAEYGEAFPSATTEFNDMTVKPGETYQYYVVAVSSENNQESSNSNVVTVLTEGATASPSPSATPSPSPGGSGSPGPTTSPKPTTSPSGSPGSSPSPTPSKTPGASPSPSPTSSPSPSPNPTASPSPSPSASPQTGSLPNNNAPRS